MVQFANRHIGDGHPCFITFEAGPTHNGLESAKRLCCVAADAGADAIKFQINDPERLVASRDQMFTYDVLVDRETGATETVEEPLFDILCRRDLQKGEWRALKAYCDKLGLAFFATIGFEDQLEFLTEIGCDSVKIASADVNYTALIRAAARTGMCLQLDTGNATIGEIEEAIDAIANTGHENVIIHHCPGGYPAGPASINLNVIPTLKRIFPYPVAYSDHTPGWDMDIAALALGANLIEKTITEDRMTRSVEHIMSLEPDDAGRFVDVIRTVEMAMGDNRRIMTDQERASRDKIRRSAFLLEPVTAGASLAAAKVEFRRPGTGIGPSLFESLEDAVFVREVDAGEMITIADLSGQRRSS